MEPAADVKAADMAAAQTHAAHMRHAAETLPAAAAAKMRYAAGAHPTTATAQMHSAAPTAKMHPAAAAEVSTTTATAEVSTANATATATTAAAAAESLCSHWHRNGRQRRQQDCANHNSAIFHEYLPALHRNVSCLGSSTRRPIERLQ
jgi:hypothetical protein